METSHSNRSVNFWVPFCLAIGFILIFAPVMTAGFSGKAFAKGAVAAEKNDFKGNVLNLSGRTIGSVDADGNILNINGKAVGSVGTGGTVFNINKKKIGSVDADGKVRNKPGTLLGSVNANGDVFNRNGRQVGSVEAFGNIVLIGGAAQLLLLKR